MRKPSTCSGPSRHIDRRQHRGGPASGRRGQTDAADDTTGDDTGTTVTAHVAEPNAAVKRPARRPGSRRSHRDMRRTPAWTCSTRSSGSQLIPDYALAAARGDDPPRGRWTLGVLALIIGALFAVAALQTTRSAPVLQSERSELISRVQTAEREQDELRGRVTTLTQEIATLRAAALGDDDTARCVESPRSTPSTRWLAMLLSADPAY